jgi:chromosome segregation ATPase
VDAELAAQVPQDKRAAINKADFALACARQDVELAELKEELADRQDDLANLNTKLAKAQARAAEINLDIAKMEAIMANKLGKAEDNRKVLEELTTDRAKNETDQSELKGKMYQATLFVRDWTQRVAQKEKVVADFKARRAGEAPAAQPAVKAAPAPAEDPVEIINPSPGVPQAQPAAPAATPGAEADLKN